MQVNKLKSTIENETWLTLNLSSNLMGFSDDETNFPHKLLLTDIQVSKICKAFANASSANINISKIQLSNMMQSRGLIGLDYLIAPIKVLFSVPKIVNNKRQFFSENKDKTYDTIKTVDNSIKGI